MMLVHQDVKGGGKWELSFSVQISSCVGQFQHSMEADPGPNDYIDTQFVETCVNLPPIQIKQ